MSLWVQGHPVGVADPTITLKNDRQRLRYLVEKVKEVHCNQINDDKEGKFQSF